MVIYKNFYRELKKKIKKKIQYAKTFFYSIYISKIKYYVFFKYEYLILWLQIYFSTNKKLKYAEKFAKI
jgi:hypothetical protein